MFTIIETPTFEADARKSGLRKSEALSFKEMKAGKAARTSRVEPNEVAEARGKTGLTQIEFAEVLHISARTLQEWEQGRREPSDPAKALIEIASRHPEVIREGLELRG